MIVFSYIVYYGVILPVSILPFQVLYFLSDVLFIVLYRLSGYRKKVVMSNIRNSFPHLSALEQKAIAVDFYHHFCDLIVESIKIFTISEKEVLQRMTCCNPEVVDRFYHEKRHIIIAGGHYNNWELFAVGVHFVIKHHPVGIYKPLANRFFDRKMHETRGKFGLGLLSTKKVRQYFESLRLNAAAPDSFTENGAAIQSGLSKLSAIIFAIDQSPSSGGNAYWMQFLGQDTAVSFGAEKFAKEYNYPVVFGRLNKVKRGHYTLEFEVISENPAGTEHGFITEKSTQLLEKDILKDPVYWLWTHRRWKKTRPVSAPVQHSAEDEEKV